MIRFYLYKYTGRKNKFVFKKLSKYLYTIGFKKWKNKKNML